MPLPPVHIGVIPALVAGIQKSACASVNGWLDPGHKARDDWLGERR
jgi:hypothetical protein